ncbi:MAG TPA: MbnP family protein [Puia sp.]|jgi:hypothetical protein
MRQHPIILIFTRFWSNRFGLVPGIILAMGISAFQTGRKPLPSGIGISDPPNLILHFKVTVHGQPFQLHKTYLNPFGESFTPDIFRFYAGKITASYKNGAQVKGHSPESYHLIDFADSASTQVALRIREGVYNEIHFLLGIDSIDQVGGAQSGPLDPVKGMFWTWNSGYLSFKIEGSSPKSTEPAHAFAYHIGGYRWPNRTSRNIKIGTGNGRPFRINREGATVLNIPLELDHFFDGITPIHIRNIPACTSPGRLARQIAENFTAVFTGIEPAALP